MAFLADRPAGGPRGRVARLRYRRRLCRLAVRQLGLKPAATTGPTSSPCRCGLSGRPTRAALVLKGTDGATSPWCSARTTCPAARPWPARPRSPRRWSSWAMASSRPSTGRDDYAGLDVKGKIVVALSGAPTGLQTEERAYYASGRTKRREAAGAARSASSPLDTPAGEARRPFDAGHAHLGELGDDLARPDGAALRRRRPASRAWRPSASRARPSCSPARRRPIDQVIAAAEARGATAALRPAARRRRPLIASEAKTSRAATSSA